MPRNGTGGYSLPSNSWNPAVNGAAATAADWQNLINDVASAIQQSVSSDGQTPMTGNLSMGGFVVSGLGAPSGTGQSLRWEQLTKGPDIASAAALPIPIEGSVFSVTGTTTITSLTDVYPGRIVYLIFPAGITITNSSSLVMPSSVNAITKANDVFAFLNESPGVWRAIAYPSRLDTATGVIPTGGYKNVLINGNFTVNQRSVSGTVTLAAGAYGHDRWKAGSGGCTYTFSTTGGVTTLTISSGTLVQAIEGINVRNGTYTMSWTGTAQGRVVGGSMSPSGTNWSIIGGVNLSVEFSTGTLALVQLEYGPNATLFEWRSIMEERALCERYFRILSEVSYRSDNSAGGRQFGGPVAYPTMRVAPSVVFGPVAFANANNVTLLGSGINMLNIYAVSVAAGASVVTITSMTLNSEL